MLQGMKRISKRGRPTLRKHPYMFAIRSVHQGGIFRKDYEAHIGRNGNKKIPALMAIARKGLKLLFRRCPGGAAVDAGATRRAACRSHRRRPGD
jgi:hypothetical protein